jgi:chromosome segregation ATPase
VIRADGNRHCGLDYAVFYFQAACRSGRRPRGMPFVIVIHIMQERSMTEGEFQTKLAEIMGEISTLPPTERQKLEKLANDTRQRHERLRQTVSSLQESLDYLRLSIKYLVFDLEATRRENTYLRKMLEDVGNE